MNSFIWKGCLIVGALIIAAASSVGFIKWKDDNAIEELAEEIIYQKTGWNIDLTPNTPRSDRIRQIQRMIDENGWDFIQTTPHKSL